MMGQAMVESMQGKSPADRYSVMTSVAQVMFSPSSAAS
jgi:hypothetical protein